MGLAFVFRALSDSGHCPMAAAAAVAELANRAVYLKFVSPRST